MGSNTVRRRAEQERSNRSLSRDRAHRRDGMPLLQDKRMLVRREELIGGGVVRVIADDLRLRADFAS
jgi:hypothetical protein